MCLCESALALSASIDGSRVRRKLNEFLDREHAEIFFYSRCEKFNLEAHGRTMCRLHGQASDDLYAQIHECPACQNLRDLIDDCARALACAASLHP